jgi:hypothetical protein
MMANTGTAQNAQTHIPETHAFKAAGFDKTILLMTTR